MERQTERGLAVYSSFLTVPPGGSLELTLDLAGAPHLVGTEDDASYRITLGHQPTVVSEQTSVTIRLKAATFGRPVRGFSVDGNTATYETELEKRTVLEGPIER